ncbi:MAG: hypothetical protein WC455_02325 [Dehalococcoidia bacterium]|jgi:hypothetical protein
MNKLSLGKFSKGNLSSMKLPKGISITQVVLILVCIVLLVMTVYFAISYFGAISERTDLNRNIQLKQQQINSIGGLQNIAALQSQLEGAQQDLIDDSPFPFEIDDIETTRLILQAATDAHISCLQYNPASADRATSINGHPYIDNSFSISSSGVSSAGERISRVIRFLNNIEELPYNAIRISGLSISRVGEEDDTWSVGFSLSILSQQ